MLPDNCHSPCVHTKQRLAAVMSTQLPDDDQSPESLYKDRWTASSPENMPGGSDESALPEVQPPSAGFIVQLFVVPAVIVMIIVAVYVLFGRLASGEADWRQLVTDVKSENSHVRWRSALTLAQVLQDDALRKEKGQQLATTPEVATALTDVLSTLLQKTSPNEEDIQQLDYMIKAVGLVDVPETAVPVLLTATEGSRDREIRKQSLNSLAVICGRAFFDRKKPVNMPELTSRVIEISKESETLFRHQAAFILGMLSAPEASDRLTEMLEDGDQMARVNAAVGLARQNSTAGIPTLEKLFGEAASWKLDPSAVKNDEQATQHFERVMLVTNAMLAIQNLAPQLDAETKKRQLELISRCADQAEDIAVQKQWVSTKAALSQ